MSSLRILMYCNNSRGLGRTLRTLNIATSLSKALDGCSILVLTDFPFVGKFDLAERVDYVHLPVLIASNKRSHFPGGLNIEYDSKLRMRRKIVQSAIKTFRPDIVMLDESLLDLPEEMQKIVTYIADEVPNAKTVWAFSDVAGVPELVNARWAEQGVMETLERFADEIWVFGAQHLFDFAVNYRVPVNVARKLFYTGYLATRTAPSPRLREKFAKLNRNLPLIMLCPSDGRDSFAMIDIYLRFLEKNAADLAVQSFIVTSPAIRPEEKQVLVRRAGKLPNVEIHRFGKNTLQYIRFAGLVINDGEYNLISELLLHKKLALVVPQMKERPDNFSRARLFQKAGLTTVTSPEEYHPLALREMIVKLLFSGPRLVQKSRYAEIPFDGFAQIVERIRQLSGLATSTEYQQVKLKVAS